jgi:hypothetical protein
MLDPFEAFALGWEGCGFHFCEFLNSYERGAKRPCRGLLQQFGDSATISRSSEANEGAKSNFRTRLIILIMVRRPQRDEKGSGGPLELGRAGGAERPLPLCAALKIKFLHRLDLDSGKRGLGKTGKDVINHSLMGTLGRNAWERPIVLGPPFSSVLLLPLLQPFRTHCF